ncbi:biofilm regulation phosphoprotein SiaC [Bordetella genomosp. 13]|uniref:biofilm regulation phosphoprotein SiaC n=1 Tax=Bordetella genomosp. 13 TaxID=463040 RepID=UPI0011A80260|nr:biofilm regulation phosphoprotein SiaC [Bordetella genomosp. 13]
MNDLNLPGTQSTPSILTDAKSGVLRMGGDSYPENSFELFGPVLEWVETYLRDSAEPLRLELELLYLNTSSIKAVMEIFDLLEAAHDQGRAVKVEWFYDMRNERVGELAEEFKEDCSFPFAVIGRE